MNPKYVIDRINVEDLEEALRLVWKEFLTFEAPDYSDEGVREFKQFIDYGAIKQKLADNQLRMWVCKNKGKIIGTLAARPPCHISLLFVDQEHHNKGIARAMLHAMTSYYKSVNTTGEITVNSSPYATEAYHRLGFIDTGPEQVVNGIRFIPMKRPLEESG